MSDMRLIFADDKKFEKHNLLEKTVRIFSVPLLNNIPSSMMKKILGGTSKDGKTVIKTGGSARALEAMYTRHERKVFSRGVLQGVADLFWHNFLSQPKAIRNRLKIVEERLENEILNLFYNKKQSTIRILTIAGGSARGIVETVYEFSNNHQGCNIEVVNIDKSEDAINLGKELSSKFNVSESFKWVKDDARSIKNWVQNNSIDIVEMVGLLDYFTDEKGLEVFKQVYNALKVDGMFITANICPNREAPFIRRIGWPNMYYREPEDLSKLLNQAGFSVDRGRIIIEPLKVHIIAIAKK